MSTPIKDLLEHILIGKEEDGAACQVALFNGVQASGALKRGPVDGIYQLRTMVPHSQTKKLEMIDLFFVADAVTVLSVPVDQKILTPGPAILSF